LLGILFDLLLDFRNKKIFLPASTLWP